MMHPMNALDLVLGNVGDSTIERQVADAAAVRRSFFTLVCAAEQVQEILGCRHERQSEALIEASNRLYHLVREGLDEDNRDTIVAPAELRRSFKAFETVLSRLGSLCLADGEEEPRLQYLWQVIQGNYLAAKYVVVRNPLFIF